MLRKLELDTQGKIFIHKFFRNTFGFQGTNNKKLKTVGGFVKVNPKSKFTLKKTAPKTSRAGMKKKLKMVASSEDLDEVLDDDKLNKQVAMSFNLNIGQTSVHDELKNICETNPVLKASINKGKYRKEPSAYLKSSRKRN